MLKSADDHTEKGVKGVQIACGSIHDSELQLDDDCVSENSFGSSLFGDNAVDEENMTADIKLDSSLPGYSDEEYPQPDDISPSFDLTVMPQYTLPMRSTQPAIKAKFSGPSICVVRSHDVIFNLSFGIDQLTS